MTARSIITVLAFLAVPGILGLIWYLTIRRAEGLKEARKHRDRFFRAAEHLVGDSHVPDSFVRVLLLLASGMPRKVIPYLLFLDLLVRPRTDAPDADVALSKIEHLPKELRDEAVTAILSALCAVSYQSALVGPFLRRALCLDGQNRHRNGNNLRKATKVKKLASEVVRFELRHAA